MFDGVDKLRAAAMCLSEHPMDMPLSLPQLNNLGIAAPCPARWEDMTGTDSVRRCALCELNVYNIAAMSADEAMRILAPALQGERVCARLLRRADGTLITRDCPIGVASARARLLRSMGRLAAAFALAIGGGAWVSSRASTTELESTNTLRIRAAQPFAAAAEWLNPRPAPLPVFMMGKISFPSPVQVPRNSATAPASNR